MGIRLLTPENSTLNASWASTVRDVLQKEGIRVPRSQKVDNSLVDVRFSNYTLYLLLAMLDNPCYRESGFSIKDITRFVDCCVIANSAAILITPSELTNREARLLVKGRTRHFDLFANTMFADQPEEVVQSIERFKRQLGITF